MTFTTALQRSVAAAALIFVNLSTLSAQSDSVYHLVVGTRISVKMDVELNSNVAGVNDTFTAVVAKPVMIRDTIAVPVGTVVEGRVRGASAASVGDDGKLDLVFELLRIPNLPSRHIEAELVEPVHARSSGLIKALSVVGGTVVGAVLGAA